jgi:hypothetical protein
VPLAAWYHFTAASAGHGLPIANYQAEFQSRNAIRWEMWHTIDGGRVSLERQSRARRCGVLVELRHSGERAWRLGRRLVLHKGGLTNESGPISFAELHMGLRSGLDRNTICLFGPI